MSELQEAVDQMDFQMEKVALQGQKLTDLAESRLEIITEQEETISGMQRSMIKLQMQITELTQYKEKFVALQSIINPDLNPDPQ